MNKIMEEDIEDISQLSILEELEDMTVMITGATGFVGKMIVHSLMLRNVKQNANIKIIACVRNVDKAKDMFRKYFEYATFTLCPYDVVNEFDYNYEVDYIIHAASVTASKMFVDKPVETIKTAIMGSINILEYARKCNKIKGILYLSSLEVYGLFKGDGIKHVSENDIGVIDFLNIRSSYSESKRMVENIFSSYGKEYALPIKIARLTQTFGSGVEYNDNRVFAEFARTISQNKNIVLHTKGETIRSYCYITDAVRAIFYILLFGENGESYNVSNKESTISIYDLARLFCENKKGTSVEIMNDINDSMGYNPTTKISLKTEKLEMLGWKSKYSIEDMVKRYYSYVLLCDD